MYDSSKEPFGKRIGVYRSILSAGIQFQPQSAYVSDDMCSVFFARTMEMKEIRAQGWVSPHRAMLWDGVASPAIRSIRCALITDEESTMRPGGTNLSKTEDGRWTTYPAWLQHSARVTTMRPWTAAQPLWECRPKEGWSWDECTRILHEVIAACGVMRTMLHDRDAPQPRIWCSPSAVSLRTDGRVLLSHWAGEESVWRNTNLGSSSSYRSVPWWAPELEFIAYATGLALDDQRSPQQFASIDIYSIGLLAYWIICGASPLDHLFPDTSIPYKYVPTEPFASVITYEPSCPEPLASAIMKALEPTPADRWTTLDAFADALPTPPKRIVWGQGEHDPVVYARTLLHQGDDKALADWLTEIRTTHADHEALWSYVWESLWDSLHRRLNTNAPKRILDVILCTVCRSHAIPALRTFILDPDTDPTHASNALQLLGSIHEGETIELLSTHWLALSASLRIFLLSHPSRMQSYAAHALSLHPENTDHAYIPLTYISWDVLARSWNEKGPTVFKLPTNMRLFCGSSEHIVDAHWDDLQIAYFSMEAIARGVLRITWTNDDIPHSVVLHEDAHRVAQVGRLVIMPRAMHGGFACGMHSDLLPYASDIKLWTVLRNGEDSRVIERDFQGFEDAPDEDSIVIDWGDEPSATNQGQDDSEPHDEHMHETRRTEDEKESQRMLAKVRVWWQTRFGDPET